MQGLYYWSELWYTVTVCNIQDKSLQARHEQKKAVVMGLIKLSVDYPAQGRWQWYSRYGHGCAGFWGRKWRSLLHMHYIEWCGEEVQELLLFHYYHVLRQGHTFRWEVQQSPHDQAIKFMTCQEVDLVEMVCCRYCQNNLGTVCSTPKLLHT